jgi:hypothetical protein
MITKMLSTQTPYIETTSLMGRKYLDIVVLIGSIWSI